MEVLEDFCYDQSNQFKKRLKVYESELSRAADRDQGNKGSEGVLSGLEDCETKTKSLIVMFNDLLTNRS